MSNITIRCPATGERLPTSVTTDSESLATNWNRVVLCPQCKTEHSGTVRMLFAADVLSEEQLRRADTR